MDFFQCLGSRGVSSVFLTTRDRGSLCSGWEARGETREEVLEVLPGEMVDTSSESGEGSNGQYNIISGLGIMVIIAIESHQRLLRLDACSSHWTLILKTIDL